MSLLQKPTNIYHTDEQNTAVNKDSWMNEFEDMFKKDFGEKVVEETLKQDKTQEFTEPEKVKEPTIDELSYDDKLEFIKKFANEFNLEFTMKVTPSIKEEPTPVVTPTIEPVKEEVVIEPEPVKEEVVIETPKKTEKPITFNFEKPEGWNKKRKKINFIKVLFNGIFGVDMDPSDFKRYDKFMDNFKPIVIILLIAGFIITGFYFKSSNNKNESKKTGIVDRAFNFCVDTYDKWTGRNKKYTSTDTLKVITQDTSVDKVIKFNNNSIYSDSFIKKETIKMNDWEAEYQNLDSNTKK